VTPVCVIKMMNLELTARCVKDKISLKPAIMVQIGSGNNVGSQTQWPRFWGHLVCLATQDNISLSKDISLYRVCLFFFSVYFVFFVFDERSPSCLIL